jgi:hypothetical protein
MADNFYRGNYISLVPAVAPVEGHYALLRNGCVMRHMVDMWDGHRGPRSDDDYWCASDDTDFAELTWNGDGTSKDDPQYDIIATISYDNMKWAAGGGLTDETAAALIKAGESVGHLFNKNEQLREALNCAHAGLKTAAKAQTITELRELYTRWADEAWDALKKSQ